MFDLQVLGSQLVKELSELIEQSVIVTDKNGFIIASTDPVRLNRYHEGASIAMRNRGELTMTPEMAINLQGVRPGIVLPIVVSDVPLGVIGITGKPEEIGKYAKLVRKVAELFVTEFLVRQERERGIRELEFFIFDLFTSDLTADLIEERAKVLNFDISQYSRVAVVHTSKQFEIVDVEDLLRLQTIHTKLKIVRWGLEKLVLLLPNITDTKLIAGLSDLQTKLKRISKEPVSIGVGEERNFRKLKESFLQAKMAAIVAEKQNRIIFEGDLTLELLFYSLPKEVKDKYIKRTIEPILTDDELLNTLKVWLNHPDSRQEIAERLHIHKNTLKYRLQKIEKMLNVDFSNKKDLAIVYTAISILD